MEVNSAKALSALVLGVGSLVAGMVPAFISDSARRRYPLLISCLLCFGAGVLLSTSLIHMLPEAREQLPEYSELTLCIGFFLVYLVDEIVHLFYGTGEHTSNQHYGSGEETHLLRQNETNNEDGEMRGKCCGDAGNPRMCHVSHTAPCNKSSSGIIGLLCALFVHSLLEGLAIGVQKTSSAVLLLLAAVSAHKFVVGFCLGAELCASGSTNAPPHSLARQLLAVLLFSAGSVVGIALGGGLETVSAFNDSVAVPIMQALAAGTLVYVTLSEVLPRERARWHEQRRCAGAAQLAATVLGFAAMYLATIYLDHDAA